LLENQGINDISDDRSASPQALILSPTRELAIQIKDNARLYTSKSALKVEILYGGVATRHQSTKIFVSRQTLFNGKIRTDYNSLQFFRWMKIVKKKIIGSVHRIRKFDLL